MNDKLTWRDYALAVGLLVFLFLIIPVGLWLLSLYRVEQRKATINNMVPLVMHDNRILISKAEELMAQEVQSYNGHDIYTAPNTRAAIATACANIQDSITSHDTGLVGSRGFCDFYILRNGDWIRADYNTIIGTQYPDDLKDFDDLLSSDDRWRLYPNGRNWRVKYKLRTEPYIILDFEVASKDRDYSGY